MDTIKKIKIKTILVVFRGVLSHKKQFVHVHSTHLESCGIFRNVVSFSCIEVHIPCD